MGLCALPIRALNRPTAALRYAQLWSKAVLFGFSKICSVKIEVIGREHLAKDRSCLIASQHQSFFDGFIWMVLLSEPSYILKKELLGIPLVGPMLSLSGMTPVDRKGGLQALRNLQDAVRKYWEGVRQIILFPQGTRTRIGQEVPLQKGIIPLTQMALEDGFDVLPAVTNSGLFWPHSHWKKFSGTLYVVIGAPIAQDRGKTGTKILAAIESDWKALDERYAQDMYPDSK